MSPFIGAASVDLWGGYPGIEICLIRIGTWVEVAVASHGSITRASGGSLQAGRFKTKIKSWPPPRNGDAGAVESEGNLEVLKLDKRSSKVFHSYVPRYPGTRVPGARLGCSRRHPFSST
eukprot:400116-Rhodomonas_salina.2